MRNKGSRWHQSEKHQNDGFVLKEGDDMKIGIIGSGRVGYSMGKYMQDHGIRVTGFYDRSAHLMRHNLQARTASIGSKTW